jgi:hypothetical protein
LRQRHGLRVSGAEREDKEREAQGDVTQVGTLQLFALEAQLVAPNLNGSLRPLKPLSQRSG